MTDVLIAGAGPVGLTMAIELKRYGVSVRIVDKAPQRTDKSKALVIWSRTLELIDRFGCADRFLSAGYKVAAANVSSGKDQLARITLSGVASPYPFALMIPQSETERLLEEHLNSLGVQVERSVELTRFAAGSKSVTSTLVHPNGSRSGEETLESWWLIGCDGAHSTVRHGLGMQFAGSTLPSNWILGDVHLSGVPTPNEIVAVWHALGVLALFPITPARYRVIADVSSTEDGDRQPADPTLEDIQKVLDERGPGGIRAAHPIWLAGFHINERKVAITGPVAYFSRAMRRISIVRQEARA
jgi:2-polyprenyl-6-methoxyphenol hydroxylase-like FAD-dependent oxidoreductase